MLRFAIFFAFVAAISALPAGPPAPYHAPAPVYDESPKPYAFQYGVADDYSGAKFNAQETADGKAVHGSYQVHLPRLLLIAASTFVNFKILPTLHVYSSIYVY